MKRYGEKWALRLVDVGDGSGDKFLPLPVELMDALRRAVGDELELSLQEDGEIWLRRAEPARS